MARFQYTVRDATGQAESGLLTADSPEQLRQVLRTNHLYLISYKEVAESTVAAPAKEAKAPMKLGGGVSPQDLVIALKQLSTFINAGLSMDMSLDTLAAQTRNRDMKLAIEDTRVQIMQGANLSSAMKRHGNVFDQITLALIEAGEGTGMLPETLRVAADQVERRHRVLRTIKSATMYPKIVIFVAIATVGGMLLLVVPSFESVYKSLKAELPPQTKALIAMSQFIMTKWWLIIVGVIVVYLAFVNYGRTGAGRRQIDLIVLKLPVVGELVRKIAMTRFVQTLLAATKGGVPVLKALSLAGATVGNSVIRGAVMDAAIGIRSGGRIGKELERTGEFPLLVTRMISSGETAGELERMLEEVNRLYEEEVDEAVGKLGKIIEPMLAVLVGGIVLFVMLALYLPIFQLTKAIKKV